MSTTFARSFTAWREAAGLTQAELAQRIGVSPATIASWETGRRHPGPGSRQQIIEAADHLQVEAAELNIVLESLGFSPVPAGRLIPILDRRKPLAVVQAECETYNWPTLAMNEDFEVVAWNAAANDLSELDFATDLAEPGARHLLRMALSEHYNKKLLNWEEVIGMMVAMWKTNGFDPMAAGVTNPYFQNLMAYVMTNHPGEVMKLLALWQETEAWFEGSRAVFEAKWCTSDGAMLRFHNQLTAWSDFDGVSSLDWHPADAETWEWLERRRAARAGNSTRPEVHDQRELSSARELLRFARERNGLTRKELATRSGISESLIYALEAGRRPLVRETIVSLAGAMQLDKAITNAILDAAGFDPIPSDISAYILGHEIDRGSRFAGNLGRRITWDAASIQGEVARYAWPALVVNERCEVIAMNQPASSVFGLDIATVPPGPTRNLFALVTDAAFIRRTENWDTVIGNVFPANLESYMAPPGSPLGAGKDADYFDSVVRHVQDREIAAGRGAAIIRKVFDSWRQRPNRRLTARIVFPLHCTPGTAAMHFNTIISPWDSMLDPYWGIELHPANAQTWHALAGSTEY